MSSSGRGAESVRRLLHHVVCVVFEVLRSHKLEENKEEKKRRFGLTSGFLLVDTDTQFSCDPFGRMDTTTGISMRHRPQHTHACVVTLAYSTLFIWPNEPTRMPCNLHSIAVVLISELTICKCTSFPEKERSLNVATRSEQRCSLIRL